ncbi:MAG TPA: LysR substrate-binding domain-containing protein [Alphaproteobacteria bacterium]|nr:LysR substrate-binding domain-containing protein [Alphaproteobacteria bacterium]
MDLRHLRNMLAVMEEGSLGKAAEKLHISQPALTKSIQRLEDQLGVKLFERKARGMEATSYAESLSAYAQSACVGMSQAIKEIKALKSGTEGVITVAGPPLIASELMPEVLMRLAAERPNLQLRIVSQNQELFTSLLNGKFNVVVAMLYNEMPRVGLTKRWLFDDKLVLVMRPDHPAAKFKKIKPQDLMSYKWAFPEGDTWHRRRLELFFEQYGMGMPRASIESREPTILRSIIVNSDHIGVIARLGVERELREGLLTAVEFDSPFMMRPIGVVRRENDMPSPAVNALIRILEAVCQERGYGKASA